MHVCGSALIVGLLSAAPRRWLGDADCDPTLRSRVRASPARIPRPLAWSRRALLGPRSRHAPAELTRRLRRRALDPDTPSLVNLPTSLLDDICDWVSGESASSTYSLVIKLIQVCRRLTPSARRAGLRKLFLNSRNGAKKLLMLLAAHSDAARAIRAIVFCGGSDSLSGLPSYEQGIAIVSQAAGLTSLEVMLDPVEMLAFVRGAGAAIASMSLVVLELDTRGHEEDIELPAADVHALVMPHRRRMREMRLAFNTSTTDARLLSSRFPALRIFTAWHLDADKIVRIVNSSPAIYSLGLDRYNSVVPRLSKSARRRIDVVVLSFDDAESAESELEDASLALFPYLFKLTVIGAMLQDHEQFLDSIICPFFDHLGVDGFTSSAYLADALADGMVQSISCLHYDAPREIWGDYDEFGEDLERLHMVCRSRGVRLEHEEIKPEGTVL